MKPRTLTFEYRLGRALFLRRVRAGMTRSELARRLGLSWNAVERVENGRALPRSSTLRAWEAELGPVVVKA